MDRDTLEHLSQVFRAWALQTHTVTLAAMTRLRWWPGSPILPDECVETSRLELDPNEERTDGTPEGRWHDRITDVAVGPSGRAWVAMRIDRTCVIVGGPDRFSINVPEDERAARMRIESTRPVLTTVTTVLREPDARTGQQRRVRFYYQDKEAGVSPQAEAGSWMPDGSRIWMERDGNGSARIVHEGTEIIPQADKPCDRFLIEPRTQSLFGYAQGWCALLQPEPGSSDAQPPIEALDAAIVGDTLHAIRLPDRRVCQRKDGRWIERHADPLEGYRRGYSWLEDRGQFIYVQRAPGYSGERLVLLDSQGVMTNTLASFDRVSPPFRHACHGWCYYGITGRHLCLVQLPSLPPT